MGSKVNAQLNAGSEYVRANKLWVKNAQLIIRNTLNENDNISFYRMSKLMFRQMFSYWKRIPFLYQFSEDYALRKNALSVMQSETRSVINMRRDQLDASAETVRKLNMNMDEPVLGVKRRMAFLDFLLLKQRETGFLTDADIQEEVDTFMFAVSYFKVDNFNLGSNIFYGRNLGSGYYRNWNRVLHLLTGKASRGAADCIRGSWVRRRIRSEYFVAIFRGSDQRDFTNVSIDSFV